ncbi:MAG TPA: luciferase family protein [Acidimicrobiales bacterium]|nr:luciferase family protein [Acidimicrobiales bacterium]
MTKTRTASEQIIAEVATWPGIEVDTGELGEVAFKVSGREIGHVHGDHAAHFSFPKAKWDELSAEGRIVPHPVFPDARGPAARAIKNDADIRDVVELLRFNYERVVARRGLPADTDT